MNYKIKGTPFPIVVCRLNPNESMICQQGGMAWMTPNMKMSTNARGGFSKMFSGESMFQNIYTAVSYEGEIAFAASSPGNIIPFQITPQHPIIAQKKAFLACEPNVQLTVHFTRKFSSGMFGGEGFIMQKLSGYGLAFLEFDGSIVEYTLAQGQSMLIDTGYLAAMDATCMMDIESVKGLGNALVGGEGFFNTRVTGPGRIWLQTMPRFKQGTVR